MNWNVNGQNYPILKLAGLLGTGTGLAASFIMLLLRADIFRILYVGSASALAAGLALLAIFLTDVTLSALAEGEMRRAKLRAASRIYADWASGTLEPPVQLHSATVRVNGEVRRLDWLADDDTNTGEWRRLLVQLFMHARFHQRSSKGERTGLTESDLVGDGRMFYGRDAYLTAIRVAKDIGLVNRTNGLATRMAEEWTYTKAISYLQTAAVLPPIKNKPPSYRPYTGGMVT